MNDNKEPVKCEFRGCESIMFHHFEDGTVQCCQCGGWQNGREVKEKAED